MSMLVVILVRPQLGENIGKAARAMLNFGLEHLRLVAPRDGWPNPVAGPAASGADIVLDQAQVFETLEDAVADLHHVWATTVRPRGMQKPVVTPEEGMAHAHQLLANDQKCGIVFGPERAGLENDDIVLCDTILTANVNKNFSSLNLAQAVILCGYEWFKQHDPAARPVTETDLGERATKEQMQGLFEHLEGELDKRDYWRDENRRPVMVRSLRNILQSANFSDQQVQTLRGVIKSLSRPAKD